MTDRFFFRFIDESCRPNVNFGIHRLFFILFYFYFIYLLIYFFVFLLIYLITYLFIYLFSYLFIFSYLFLFIYLFIYLFSGSKEILCIEFQPTEARKYALSVALRVEMNPKIRCDKNTFICFIFIFFIFYLFFQLKNNIYLLFLFFYSTRQFILKIQRSNFYDTNLNFIQFFIEFETIIRSNSKK